MSYWARATPFRRWNVRNARDFPLFSASQFFLSPKVGKLRKTQTLINRAMRGRERTEIWQMPFREIDVYSGRRLWMDYINIIIRCFSLHEQKESNADENLDGAVCCGMYRADDVITSRAGWRIDDRCTRFDDLLKVREIFFLYETFAIVRHFSNYGSEAFSSLTHDNPKSICMLLSPNESSGAVGRRRFFRIICLIKSQNQPNNVRRIN